MLFLLRSGSGDIVGVGFEVVVWVVVFCVGFVEGLDVEIGVDIVDGVEVCLVVGFCFWVGFFCMVGLF